MKLPKKLRASPDRTPDSPPTIRIRSARIPNGFGDEPGDFRNTVKLA
jgi:hypothetical protein